jgi:hypothetical protein
MRRTLTVLATAVTAGALLIAGTATAHAADMTRKPSGDALLNALIAMDRVEDADILGQPAPKHDPALGSQKVRLNIDIKGYNDDNWGDRVTGVVPFIIKARGLADGPLTVWAMAGGHMCAPGTRSKWMKWTIRNGDVLNFPVKNRSYTTSVFFRVSDRNGAFRYGKTTVRVTPE